MSSLESRPAGKLQRADETAMLRAELNDTLLQLQDRLNVAKRVDEAIDDTKLRVVELKQRRPLAFVAGVAGVAACVGLVVWGIAKRATR